MSKWKNDVRWLKTTIEIYNELIGRLPQKYDQSISDALLNKNSTELSQITDELREEISLVRKTKKESVVMESKVIVRKPTRADEARIQSECVIWFHNNFPHLRKCFFAVQNNSENVVRAMQRKAMGLVSGVSDTILIYNGHVYCFEFKTEIGRQSKDQKEFEDQATEQGARYYLIRSADQFKMLINTITCSGVYGVIYEAVRPKL